MPDNLLESLALQPIIFLAEVINRTRRCALTWNLRQAGNFNTDFSYNGDFYKAFLTPLQGAFVLDIVRGRRNVLSLSSLVYTEVAELYRLVTDITEIAVVQQLLEDLDTLNICRDRPTEKGHGGLVLGGTAICLRSVRGSVSGGAVLGGTAPNEILVPTGALMGGSAIFSGGRIEAESTGGTSVGGTSVLHSQYMLYTANREGSGIMQLMKFDGTLVNIRHGVGDVDDVVVDYTYGKIFWAHSTAIASCNVDGTGHHNMLPLSIVPTGISLDRLAQKIYWTDQNFKINRCDYDGSNAVILATSAKKPTSIEVDVANSALFWAGSTSSDSTIYTSTLLGGGVTAIRTHTVLIRAITKVGDRLYSGGADYLESMDLDGSNITGLSMAGLSIIDDMSYDPEFDLLYLYDIGTKQIYRASTDMTSLEQLTTDSITRGGVAIPR